MSDVMEAPAKRGRKPKGLPLTEVLADDSAVVAEPFPLSAAVRVPDRERLVTLWLDEGARLAPHTAMIVNQAIDLPNHWNLKRFDLWLDAPFPAAEFVDSPKHGCFTQGE